MNPDKFLDTKPALVIEDYFSGKTRGWGIVFGRSGEVVKQFTVDIVGVWEGSTLVLTEDFLYSTGATEQRVWTIKKLDEHTYNGTAHDVVGTAIGKQYGQALNWNYVLDVPVGSSSYHIRFDDWMLLQPDGVLLNRAQMSKFGLSVGEVVLSFRKM